MRVTKQGRAMLETLPLAKFEAAFARLGAKAHGYRVELVCPKCGRGLDVLVRHDEYPVVASITTPTFAPEIITNGKRVRPPHKWTLRHPGLHLIFTADEPLTFVYGCHRRRRCRRLWHARTEDLTLDFIKAIEKGQTKIRVRR